MKYFLLILQSALLLSCEMSIIWNTETACDEILPCHPSLHSILIESSFSDIQDKAWHASEFLSRTAAILYPDSEDLKWRGINYRQQIKHVEIRNLLSVTKSLDHTARKNDNFCFFPLKYFSS